RIGEALPRDEGLFHDPGVPPGGQLGEDVLQGGKIVEDVDGMSGILLVPPACRDTLPHQMAEERLRQRGLPRAGQAFQQDQLGLEHKRVSLGQKRSYLVRCGLVRTLATRKRRRSTPTELPAWVWHEDRSLVPHCTRSTHGRHSV